LLAMSRLFINTASFLLLSFDARRCGNLCGFLAAQVAHKEEGRSKKQESRIKNQEGRSNKINGFSN
jgi:hypothetical protein